VFVLKQRGSQRPNVGVDFGETDVPAVVTAYGGDGVRVEDAATPKVEAEEALRRGGPTLLACRIERRAYDRAL